MVFSILESVVELFDNLLGNKENLFPTIVLESELLDSDLFKKANVDDVGVGLLFAADAHIDENGRDKTTSKTLTADKTFVLASLTP